MSKIEMESSSVRLSFRERFFRMIGLGRGGDEETRIDDIMPIVKEGGIEGSTPPSKGGRLIDCKFLNLPDEVTRQVIASYLSVNEMIRIKKTCKDFNKLFDDFKPFKKTYNYPDLINNQGRSFNGRFHCHYEPYPVMQMRNGEGPTTKRSHKQMILDEKGERLESIKIQLTFQDQGWGYRKGEILLALCCDLKSLDRSTNGYISGPHIGSSSRSGYEIVKVEKSERLSNGDVVYMIEDDGYVKMVTGQTREARYFKGTLDLFSPSNWELYQKNEKGMYILTLPGDEVVDNDSIYIKGYSPSPLGTFDHVAKSIHNIRLGHFINEEKKIIQPCIGDFFHVLIKVGGGGGHTMTVRNFSVTFLGIKERIY